MRYRGKFDATPELVRFADTLEAVCINSVEGGAMTRDLALLIGAKQAYLTTDEFLDAIDANLQTAMSG